MIADGDGLGVVINDIFAPRVETQISVIEDIVIRYDPVCQSSGFTLAEM